jgi:hypothetical protein
MQKENSVQPNLKFGCMEYKHLQCDYPTEDSEISSLCALCGSVVNYRELPQKIPTAWDKCPTAWDKHAEAPQKSEYTGDPIVHMSRLLRRTDCAIWKY